MLPFFHIPEEVIMSKQNWSNKGDIRECTREELLNDMEIIKANMSTMEYDTREWWDEKILLGHYKDELDSREDSHKAYLSLTKDIPSLIGPESPINNTVPEEVNMKLKDIIKSLNIKAADLAEEVGYSTSTIYNVLNGKAGKKATAAVEAYLEEIKYAPEDISEPESVEPEVEMVLLNAKCMEQDFLDRPFINLECKVIPKDKYISEWHEANKHLLEAPLSDMVVEDEDFRKNASMIKDAIYNVEDKFLRGRRKPNLKAKWNEEGTSNAGGGYDKSEQVYEEFKDVDGNIRKKYDKGGSVGKVQRQTSENIIIGKANQSEHCGRHSIYEEGYNNNTVRILDARGNFLCATEARKEYKILLREKNMTYGNNRKFESRKKRKDIAIKAVNDYTDLIKNSTDKGYIKTELLGKGKFFNFLTKRLQDEADTTWLTDHCYYLDCKQFKKEDIAGKTADELVELAKATKKWKTINKVFWRLMYQRIEKTTEQSQPEIFKETFTVKKDTQEETYHKVQKILDRIPSDDAADLGNLIRQGVGLSFGLTQSDAKTATWYCHQYNKKNGYSGHSIRFSREVFKSLIEFGKSKYKRVAGQGVVKIA
jgi:transcriptional regulator with XRE-family HTH domain